jgi:hypothetical protein
MTSRNAEFYVLRISPGEDDGEGENHDEWFRTFDEAHTRREALRRDPAFWRQSKLSADLAIDRVAFSLDAQSLLDVLNRRFPASTRVALPAKRFGKGKP